MNLVYESWECFISHLAWPFSKLIYVSICALMALPWDSVEVSISGMTHYQALLVCDLPSEWCLEIWGLGVLICTEYPGPFRGQRYLINICWSARKTEAWIYSDILHSTVRLYGFNLITVILQVYHLLWILIPHGVNILFFLPYITLDLHIIYIIGVMYNIGVIYSIGVIYNSFKIIVILSLPTVRHLNVVEDFFVVLCVLRIHSTIDV